MLYHQLIENHLCDRIILSDAQGDYTYSELNARARALGEYWHSQGIHPGDRIAVINDNTVRTVIALLACLAYGFIFVPITAGDIEEREYIISDCQPVLVLDGSLPELTPDEFPPRPVISAKTTGYILYTSGSTSRPKGIVASYASIIYCIEAINARLGNSERDRILCCLPLSFDYGLYQIFLALRYSAALILLPEGISLLELPDILRKRQITAFPVVPTLLRGLVRSHLLERVRLPELRYISSTGEVLEPQLIAKAESCLPGTEVIPMYGLTECKRVSIMPFGQQDKKYAGSCGLPLPGVSVELDTIDPETGIGELIVYGPNVMNGYWGDAKTTAAVFGYDGHCRPFVRTGDLFTVDEEGYLYFKGRLKNLIKVRGHGVSGDAIEEQLHSLDGVRELRVLGLFDERDGERACAFVYADDLSVEARIRAYSDHLPDFMKIKTIYLFDHPLPKNKNGKIDDATLRQVICSHG